MSDENVELNAGLFAQERRAPIIHIPIKLLSRNAQMPHYGSSDAAGMDLYADVGDLGVVQINPGERKLIKTGIAMAIPPGYYGRVAPRSGLAMKNGIDIMAGVIDGDYRGEVGAILINFGSAAFNVHTGDRIAQLILERYAPAYTYKVGVLPGTKRGTGGFGSTGK
jgi:dUTP pyrophosphatase